MADSNGEHAAIQKQLGDLGRDIQRDLGGLGEAVARIEVKVESLPCVERGRQYAGMDDRISALEAGANYARGAATAVKVIWGAVVLGVVSIVSFALQVYRVMKGM